MLRIDTTTEQLDAWQRAPHLIPRSDVVLQVDGPGAISCMQGIFTNDIERAGPNSLSWGAVLTPKGMIITDLWVWRRESDLLLIVPALGAPALLELFRKSFPPRLAKVHDLREQLGVWWLTSGEVAVDASSFRVEPSGPAPFRSMIIGPPAAVIATTVAQAPAEAADVLALLAGWPVLGREIDARTLVQEVRFDDLKGVRYDKGCYVGQETVSRLHFRGHPNRTLRAAIGRGAAPVDATVTAGADGREVGTLSTLLVSGSHWVASTRLRKEVASGERLMAGGHDAQVHEFPVTIDRLA